MYEYWIHCGTWRWSLLLTAGEVPWARRRHEPGCSGSGCNSGCWKTEDTDKVTGVWLEMMFHIYLYLQSLIQIVVSGHDFNPDDIKMNAERIKRQWRHEERWHSRSGCTIGWYRLYNCSTVGWTRGEQTREPQFKLKRTKKKMGRGKEVPEAKLRLLESQTPKPQSRFSLLKLLMNQNWSLAMKWKWRRRKDGVRQDKDGRFRLLSLFKHNYAWRRIMILV